MGKLFRIAYCFLCVAHLYMVGCGTSHPTSEEPGKVSETTGRPFNQPDTLRVVPFKGGPPIPGMAYIEGGYMVRGSLRDDKLNPGRSTQPVTVTSFYMDKTPITNLAYREYLDDLKKSGLDEAYKAALPKHETWHQSAPQNAHSYLNSDAFMYHPVIGVSWSQATDYCAWRTEKVRNEMQKQAANQVTGDGDVDELNMPVFRLPTAVEWEYAARGVVGRVGIDYLRDHQRIYPWPGTSLRDQDGNFLANFKRGPGNYQGAVGESDHAAPTSYVYAYPFNGFGLYDMVGNVCCWVADGLHDGESSSDFNPVTGRNHESDPIRMYKGCSWKDCAYFLQIDTLRGLHKDKATDYIGFRCVASIPGK